ncbi:hypothetical protein SAY87_029144 [Trapa incisa]|uniref:Auxin-responsive protein n=1 Tax=Trapa incisa TaxID=236973 RepID=A0AAN7QSQ0_9MYRT|nr:hypothetical protein SAY87_029144 [Trapa incisa]
MDGVTGKGETGPKFFCFVQGNSKDYLMSGDGGSSRKGASSSEERTLELKLGPPGGEEEFWAIKEYGKSSYFSHVASVQKGINNNMNSGQKFSADPAPKANGSSGSQKRTASPVVGWPPIRSSRRNLSSSRSLKLPPKFPDVVHQDKISLEKPAENKGKGLFVKINMEGVPIGRKVNLKARDSYEKLASSVDQLFRGLLAAQWDSTGIETKQDNEKPISGVLDGSGEYTLVYEDNEGDMILVGDVPWDMFVSTVKRLHVLKSSELSATNW